MLSIHQVLPSGLLYLHLKLRKLLPIQVGMENIVFYKSFHSSYPFEGTTF